jgi:ArsR family transcriptional regulator, arsenate/arsenite/antimonite-responsive transcriptional repressor
MRPGTTTGLTLFVIWRTIGIMREFMNLSKALADANRVRLVLALRGRELCACQLTELFGLAPSTMSKHLSILYQARLVNARKEGRWVYYSLPGKGAPPPVRAALDWVNSSLADHEQTAADGKRLKQVLKINPTELCRKQCHL